VGRANEDPHPLADREAVRKKGRGDAVAATRTPLVTHRGDRQVNLALELLLRGGDRIEPGLERSEGGSQLGQRRAGRREGFQQIEEVGVFGASPRVTLCHGLQDHGFVMVQGARGQHLERLIRRPADFAGLRERLCERAFDPVR
jgi:hypothetical protein